MMQIESLESRSLLSGIAHFGDATNDARINAADFVVLVHEFGSIGAADFNLDGRVNAIDFSILAANFGRSETMATDTFNSTGTEHLPIDLDTSQAVTVVAIGAGGNSGTSTLGEGGGGGGSYASSDVKASVTPGTNVAVTIGGAGADTSFGSLVIAKGGATGSTSSGGAGGAASGSTGTTKKSGGAGGAGGSGVGGGGGGGSGTSGADGTAGGNGSAGAGGAGGTGSATGGAGGAVSAGGNNGAAPGAGAGGGGAGINAATTGGAGRVTVTYTQIGTRHFLGTASGNFATAGNYSENSAPGSTDIVSVDAGTAGFGSFPSALGGLTTFGGLIVNDNGGSDALDFLNSLRVNGNVSLNNGGGTLRIGSINGTLTSSANTIEIVNLAAADTLTIGSNSTSDLTIDTGVVGATIVFASGNYNSINFNDTWVGKTIHVNGSVELLNLNNTTFSATTVIEGPGTATNFIVASGNTYATQLSGAKAIGSTVSGTYTLAMGFSPSSIRDDNGHDLNDSSGTNVTIGGGSYSFVVSQAAIVNGFNFSSLRLNDDAKVIVLGIGGFVIGGPRKLSVGLGVGV